jgi:hypothetical protein
MRVKEKIDSFSAEKEHSKRVTVLLAISKYEADIRSLLNAENIANLNLIIGRLSQLFNAFKACNTFIFPKGEIEHYYTQSEVNYLSITNKDTYFHTERDFLLQIGTKEEILDNYPELTEILKEAVPIIEIEILKHVKFEVFEWIHKVQTGIAKGEIDNVNDLKRSAKINYSLYNQILELQELNIEEDRTFECQIIIKETISAEQPVVNFNQLTNAHNFEI